MALDKHFPNSSNENIDHTLFKSYRAAFKSQYTSFFFTSPRGNNHVAIANIACYYSLLQANAFYVATTACFILI